MVEKSPRRWRPGYEVAPFALIYGGGAFFLLLGLGFTALASGANRAVGYFLLVPMGGLMLFLGLLYAWAAGIPLWDFFLADDDSYPIDAAGENEHEDETGHDEADQP